MTDNPENPGKPADADRIAKVIARAGLASRREAERMIREGRVTVNGQKIDSPALDVLPTDLIVVDGRKLDEKQDTRLWLYYKPVGLVTSDSDEKGRQTVFDALPRDLPRVMSIGRLDLTSEGLLLLTNDGELKRRAAPLPGAGERQSQRPDLRAPATGRDHRWRGFRADGDSAGQSAGGECLADRRHPRRPEPRDPSRDDPCRLAGEPVDPRRLWPVQAGGTGKKPGVRGQAQGAARSTGRVADRRGRGEGPRDAPAWRRGPRARQPAMARW